MAEIFLMEDSPALRRIYIAELREAGHNVTALENGSESHDGNFFDRADILVTDLEMQS
jgi:DNA-binding NtrC family response regulator